jgi:Cellulase (glycosyl hydrolase family 5)
VLGKFPVIFTEFGGNGEDTYKDLDYYTYVTAYVNTNELHYTGWAWWVEPNTP